MPERRPDLPLFARQPIERRTFLAGALTTLLAGCSGGGESFVGGTGATGGQPGSLDDPPAGTAVLTGQVDLSLFPGTNLQVQSAFLQNAPVRPDGSFTTLASTTAAQLLFLTDTPAVAAQSEGGVARLLGFFLSVPDTVGRLTGVDVNALSTAVATVFLTPGVLVTHPEPALALVQRIVTNLSSLAALVAHFATELPRVPLNVLMLNPLTRTLVNAVVNELLGQLPEAGGGVTAQLATADAPNTSPLNLANAGWRFVALIRQDLDAQGNELGHVAPELTSAQLPGIASTDMLPGVNPVTWGGLFTASTGSPGAGVDTRMDFARAVRPGVAKVVYWLYGPAGRPDDPEELPDTIPASELNDAVLGVSIVYYLLFPVLDLIGGAGDALTGGLKKAMEIWALAAGGVSLDGLRAAFVSGDAGNIKSAAIDMVAGGVALGAAATAVLASGPAATAAGAVALLAGGFAALFGIINFELALHSWSRFDYLEKVEIELQPSRTRLDHVPETAAVNKLGEVLYFSFQEQEARGVWLRSGVSEERLTVFDSHTVLLDDESNAVYATDLIDYGIDGGTHFGGRLVWTVRQRDGSSSTLPLPTGAPEPRSGIVPTDISPNGILVGRWSYSFTTTSLPLQYVALGSDGWNTVEGGALQLLDLGGRFGIASPAAMKVNSSGQMAITGYDGLLSASTFFNLLLNGDGSSTLLPTSAETPDMRFHDLNDAGEVLATIRGQTQVLTVHGLWKDGDFTPFLPLPGAESSEVVALSNPGLAIGTSNVPDRQSGPVLTLFGTETTRDLSALLPPDFQLLKVLAFSSDGSYVVVSGSEGEDDVGYVLKLEFAPG